MQSFLYYIYLLIFLYLADQFLQISPIDKVIYTKIFKIETDFIRELLKIVTLVIFYGFYEDTNPDLFCISNAQDSPLKYIKCYF